MSILDGLSTRAAERAYAIANTPYSLLRRLQPDPVVSEIRKRHDPVAILDALKEALLKEPKQAREVVEPYLLLLALSDNIELLKQAAALPAPHSRWYAYVAPVLVQGFKASSRIILPGEILSPDPAKFQTTSPTTTRTFVLSTR